MLLDPRHRSTCWSPSPSACAPRTRVKNTADFAIAGRSLPLVMIVTTTFATWFGSETVLGIPAKFVQGGLNGVVEDPFGAGICLILVGLFFAAKLYRMNLLTIGDYYRERYGRSVEVVCSLDHHRSATSAGCRRRSRRSAWCSTCCPAARSRMTAGHGHRHGCRCWSTRCSAACGRWP